MSEMLDCPVCKRFVSTRKSGNYLYCLYCGKLLKTIIETIFGKTIK